MGFIKNFLNRNKKYRVYKDGKVIAYDDDVTTTCWIASSMQVKYPESCINILQCHN